ncbi:MAG: nucleotidyltransferase domain-containing protein [Deltaproteobacteria bacterium]|nr:nucleotidyltransferase domain-containing protein [Deltaproteobacteria bacterium]
MELSGAASQRLEDLGLATLYLFGSRAQGISRSLSDYDFGLLLKDPLLIKNGSQKLYQEIYEILEGEVSKRVNLDIVFLDGAPLQLRYHVIRYGKVLLNADPSRRGDFEERTLEEHADFEPYRRLFEESTLARIP